MMEVMEWWNNGVMENWSSRVMFCCSHLDSHRDSNIPLLQMHENQEQYFMKIIRTETRIR
jgi:hypothetical protein